MNVEIESFGDWLILIHKPRIFIKRVEKALKKSGYHKVIHNKVDYYRGDYVGEVGAFKKHCKFEKQSEFRLYIENESNQTIENIYIGSLEDIATIRENVMIKLKLLGGGEKVLYIRQKKERKDTLRVEREI